ncbi:MAG TPA: peptidoglycan-binding domain-containing protein [Allocoleopsis sp.]
METFAYIHIETVSQANLELKPFTFNPDHRPKLINLKWLYLIITLIIVSLSNNVLALTKGEQMRMKNMTETLRKSDDIKGKVISYSATGRGKKTVNNKKRNVGYIHNIKNNLSAPAKAKIEAAKKVKPEDKLSVRLEICKSNDDVYELQKRLKKLGYYQGPVTGFFGRLTEAAVKRFQEAKGLEVDGIVGSQTKLALLNE